MRRTAEAPPRTVRRRPRAGTRSPRSAARSPRSLPVPPRGPSEPAPSRPGPASWSPQAPSGPGLLRPPRSTVRRTEAAGTDRRSASWSARAASTSRSLTCLRPCRARGEISRRWRRLPWGRNVPDTPAMGPTVPQSRCPPPRTTGRTAMDDAQAARRLLTRVELRRGGCRCARPRDGQPRRRELGVSELHPDAQYPGDVDPSSGTLFGFGPAVFFSFGAPMTVYQGVLTNFVDTLPASPRPRRSRVRRRRPDPTTGTGQVDLYFGIHGPSFSHAYARSAATGQLPAPADPQAGARGLPPRTTHDRRCRLQGQVPQPRAPGPPVANCIAQKSTQ